MKVLIRVLRGLPLLVLFCVPLTTDAKPGAVGSQVDGIRRRRQCVAKRFNFGCAEESLPRPNSGLPEFGSFKMAQVGYIRLGLGRVVDPGLDPGETGWGAG